MTLQELEQLDSATITPAIAAAVMRCDPNSLRKQIIKDPAALGFPVSRVGHKSNIPREAFIRYMKGLAYAENHT